MLRHLLMGGLALLLSCSSLRAQDDEPMKPIRIPAIKPATDFYGGIGTGVKVAATVEPSELTTEEWLTFTLTLSRLDNARDAEKPRLGKLEAFSRDFQVDDFVPDPPWDPARPNQRVFRYRLRPLAPGMKEVPGFTYKFFDPKRIVPDRQELKAYGTTWTEAIPITVRIPAVVTKTEVDPVAAVPLTIPSFAETFAHDADALERRTVLDRSWLLCIVLAGPPLLALLWVLAWRHLYPDAARLASRMRSSAARKALALIQSSHDAAVLAPVVRHYMQQRHDLPATAQTAHEIVRVFAERSYSADVCAAIQTFFEACDAARFAPVVEEMQLGDQAAELVARLEDNA